MIAGAAIAGDQVYTWGDQLLVWSLPSLEKRTLASGSFQPAGCVWHGADGISIFLQEDSKLTCRKAPDWNARAVDTGIDMTDCASVTLFGRPGILVIQRGMQLRFYEPPDYSYTELYSFYSASRQGGLLLHDIDGDGIPDLFCGNYWMQSPRELGLPWHIFAMELYNQAQESASLRVALEGANLIIAQQHMPDGLVTRLRRPADAKQLWGQEQLGVYHFP